MNTDIWTKISGELSENSLKELHSIIKKRLTEEDAGIVTKNCEVRENQDWREQADIFEQAMIVRNIDFDPIVW